MTESTPGATGPEGEPHASPNGGPPGGSTRPAEISRMGGAFPAASDTAGGAGTAGGPSGTRATSGTGATSGPTGPGGTGAAGAGGPGGAPGAGGAPAVVPKYSPWLILFTLCLGFFMILLDTTIVNVAIPQMSAHLNASLSDILWILNGYILVYAVLLITAGRLGDLYGPKQLFLLGLVIFTAASAACGLAANPTQMIIFRIVQGLGGALLTPQTLSTITMIFPPDRRGAAFGLWGAVAGVSTIAGPVVGGWLVTDYSWRWIFFVNVPVGIVTLVLAAIVMPNIRLNRRHSFDLVGVALSTAALFLITYGLIEGQPHKWGKVWGPITIPMLIGAGVILLGVFLWVQYLERDKEPLVPFELFKDRNFSVMNYVVASIGFGMLGLFLPLTIFLQSVLGLSALQAGLTTAPMSVISMFVAPVAGRFADKIGGKWILFAGVSLFASGMGLIIASTEVGESRWNMLPGLIVAGFGLGMTFAPLQTVAMRNIQPRLAGAASGLINTTRQLGAVIGSAAVGALLQSQLADKFPPLVQNQLNGPLANAPAQVKQGFATGFSNAASAGLEVTGQAPTSAGLNQLPSAVQDQLKAAGKFVFDHSFVQAMHVTLVLPIAVMGVAALSVLLVKGRNKAAAEAAAAPGADQAAEVGEPSVAG